MIKPIPLISFLLFYCLLTNAQTPGLEVLGSPREESVLLRWAPNTPSVWNLANKYGYIVERYTILQNGEIPENKELKRLTPTPVKPFPLPEWEPYSNDRYVSIAASCIYDSTLTEPLTGIPNPHEVYRKYQEKQHRYSFAIFAADQSILVARLSGLFLEDKSAQPNEKYLYRVFVNCPDSLAVDTGSVFTGISEYQPLPPPQTPMAKWNDKKVDLSWNILYLNHIYNSYIVEKSVDGGKTYTPISDNALVQLTDESVSPEYMFRSDSFPDNQTTVFYRIKGISAFGETGPPSEAVSGNGILPIKSAPVITENKLINNEKIYLEWEYPEKMNPYITGFRIYQSPSPKGKKKVIYDGKEPARRSFTDSVPDMTNYYLISVYNQNTEEVSPLTTYTARIDSFPPAKPKNLTGSIDTTGMATISWQPNTDDDLEGYRVYGTNHPEHEFMLVTPSVLTDTTFNIPINIRTLTRNIYYQVRAIDVRQNQSEFSEILVLERPDIIAPSSPRLQGVSQQKNSITVIWVNSLSDDVIRHHIYRRTFPDSTFIKIASLEKNESLNSAYEDKNISNRNEYAYYIIAEDKSGLQSLPSNHGYINPSSNFKEHLQLNKEKFIDNIRLSWDIDAIKKVERIIIYRSVEEEPCRLYGNSETDEFVDNVLSPGKKYQYIIKAIYEDGSSSPMSNSVIVKM